MTDYTKLAKAALNPNPTGDPFTVVLSPTYDDLAQALLACDRERQEAVAQRDEYGRDQYQQGVEDTEALAQRYRDAAWRFREYWGHAFFYDDPDKGCVQGCPGCHFDALTAGASK